MSPSAPSQPSSLILFQPTSVDEAIDLIEASAAPLDSPTHRRFRTPGHLHDTFTRRRRRPEWVWAARDETGACVGLVAVLSPAGAPDRPEVMDLLALPARADHAVELLVHASTQARALGVEEACVFAPPGATWDAAGLRPLSAPLAAAGWRLLVERRHYEFEPAPALGRGRGTDLRMEQLTDPADPRLAAVHREVMRRTLDAHDVAAVARVGFDAACAEGLAYLLDADPVDCLHLAHDAGGTPVGLVSGLSLPTGRGFVLFVGVAVDHRGHGYGGQLLAWMTRRLIEAGSTTLVADTDETNAPMAAAFAREGWPQTETRIDLVPEPT